MNTENNYTETDLGNVAPNPRGEFSESKEYEYLDYVYFEGGSYLCLAELGTKIVGVKPEAGKVTKYWQAVALPGGLTPEYVAMHDRVENLSEQVEADAQEVRDSKLNIEGMEANVEQLQAQATKSAESAENSKDEAAGYASSAETSRQQAETSEQNINAQVTGFDEHVAQKTSSAETDIENARIAANKAVVQQQNESIQTVKDETSQYISSKQKEAESAIVDKAEEYNTSVEKDMDSVHLAAIAEIKKISDEGDLQVENVKNAEKEAIQNLGGLSFTIGEDGGIDVITN